MPKKFSLSVSFHIFGVVIKDNDILLVQVGVHLDIISIPNFESNTDVNVTGVTESSM